MRKSKKRFFTGLLQATIAFTFASCTVPSGQVLNDPLLGKRESDMPALVSTLQSAQTISQGENEQQEAIRITSPLHNEHVLGDIEISGMADPTFEQNLVISLIGSDGQEILRTNTIINADASIRGPFKLTAMIPGSIQPQPAILQTYSVSAKDGSLIHLSSVLVFIDSKQDNQLRSPDVLEQIMINIPISNSNHANSLLISGKAFGIFENTLNYTVCGEITGSQPDMICGTVENRLVDGTTTTDAPEMGQPGSFEIILDSINTYPASAVLVVYSTSPMNGSITHAASTRLFP